MWQAEADTELTQSTSPVITGGQLMLTLANWRYSTAHIWSFELTIHVPLLHIVILCSITRDDVIAVCPCVILRVWDIAVVVVVVILTILSSRSTQLVPFLDPQSKTGRGLLDPQRVGITT